MNEPVWLEPRVAVALHERLLADHGGASGIRDTGLLESALARPRQIFAYQEQTDLPGLAAAYAVGIVRNYPFVDGNKRTGFMAAYVFLGRNELRLIATEAEATVIMLELAAGSVDESGFAAWLRDNVEIPE